MHFQNFSQVLTREGCDSTILLEDNEVSISHILQIDPINAGSILLTANLVAPKRENMIPFKQLKEMNGGNSLINLV